METKTIITARGHYLMFIEEAMEGDAYRNYTSKKHPEVPAHRLAELNQNQQRAVRSATLIRRVK